MNAQGLSSLFNRFNQMIEGLRVDTPTTPRRADTSVLPGLPAPAAAVSDPEAVDEYVPAAKETTDTTQDTEGGQSGAQISMHFNLFYSLSQRVHAEMGSKGSEKFQRVTAKVTETFRADFSLNIDGVGKYLNATDKSLDIDPAVTDEFLDSIDGMADMTAESLNTFLDEADDFFAELEAKFGDFGGAFDDMRDLVKQQAEAFFADVQQLQNDMGMPGGLGARLRNAPPPPPPLPPTNGEDGEGGAAAAAGLAGKAAPIDLSKLLESLEADQDDDAEDDETTRINAQDNKNGTTADGESADAELIPLAGAKGVQVGREDYRQFLQLFTHYSQRLSLHFSQRLVSGIPGYPGMTSAGSQNTNAAAGATNAVDLAKSVDAATSVPATVASSDAPDVKLPMPLLDLTA